MFDHEAGDVFRNVPVQHPAHERAFKLGGGEGEDQAKHADGQCAEVCRTRGHQQVVLVEQVLGAEKSR